MKCRTIRRTEDEPMPSLGRADGSVTLDEAITHATAIVAATDLPVSAGLENCFADAPDGVTRTGPPRGAGRAGRLQHRGLLCDPDL
jgi:phosphohistidine swiveling domain-containing protein